MVLRRRWYAGKGKRAIVPPLLPPPTHPHPPDRQGARAGGWRSLPLMW
jgi:hypothetical protein